ncbi:MAG: molybdenum cofactor biosynthesis protein MoaE [Polyangiaceae bacterium]
MNRCSLSHEPLNERAVTALVANPRAGAIDVFLGVVRNHSEGREVTKLEYEAYEAMATKEMERICDDIEKTWPGTKVAIAHRVGTLVVGDVAVVCAASAPHRGEAFAACRALIDRVKANVPIWKREFGPDGAAWVGWQDARCGHDHGAPHS